MIFSSQYPEEAVMERCFHWSQQASEEAFFAAVKKEEEEEG